jgi:hypothetical protein
MFYLMKLRLRDFSPHHPPHTSIVAQNTYFVNSMNDFCPNCASVLYLYFVRSGLMSLPGVSGATFRGSGINGYWWSLRGSSTRYDGVATPSAYSLAFNESTVYPSFGPNDCWHGFPLRCLSTVLDM